MTITIQEGKFYRTQYGRKVGPMERVNPHGTSYRWRWSGWLYFDDGRCGSYSPGSVVSEWTDEPTGPVRTHTVTEIVTGTYGPVEVIGEPRAARKHVEIRLTASVLASADLRAAAVIFNQLADALEEGE